MMMMMRLSLVVAVAAVLLCAVAPGEAYRYSGKDGKARTAALKRLAAGSALKLGHETLTMLDRMVLASDKDTDDEAIVPGLAASMVAKIAAEGVEKKDGWATKIGPYTVDNLDPWEEKKSKGSRAPDGVSRDALTRVPKSKGTWATLPDKFVLHTTEGPVTSLKGAVRALDRGNSWPHFIVCKDTKGQIRIGQFASINYPMRALVTNNRYGAVQVEICSYAKKPFTSEDRKLTQAVGYLWRWLNEYTGGKIPLKVADGVEFAGSSSYGSKSKSRLTTEAFKNAKGLTGHQHVPSNSHWDPGMIDPQKLLDYSKDYQRKKTASKGIGAGAALVGQGIAAAKLGAGGGVLAGSSSSSSSS
eukprot:TRINITY_DN66222_c4_g3_i1.p1 TRINITY_DN66222_c4_g3~~TRINITY_DN66222_c4_g3_i1.p1  ORF type:complete len:358 (-),score=180.68 TRINITY_DN66222_c4_g3_i1:783-1856(-)